MLVGPRLPLIKQFIVKIKNSQAVGLLGGPEAVALDEAFTGGGRTRSHRPLPTSP